MLKQQLRIVIRNWSMTIIVKENLNTFCYQYVYCNLVYILCQLANPYGSIHVRYAYMHCAHVTVTEILEKFMKGEHVTRHTPGIWNGIWTDMMIETTFMRQGKGPNGIIGITLTPNT